MTGSQVPEVVALELILLALVLGGAFWFLRRSGRAGRVEAVLLNFFKAQQQGFETDDALRQIIAARLDEQAPEEGQRLSDLIDELNEDEEVSEGQRATQVLYEVLAAEREPLSETEAKKLRESMDHHFSRLSYQRQRQAAQQQDGATQARTPEGQELVQLFCPDCGTDTDGSYRCPNCGSLVLP